MARGVGEGRGLPLRELLSGGFCAPASCLAVSNKRLALGIWLHPQMFSRPAENTEKISGCFKFSNTWYSNNDDNSNNNYISDYIDKYYIFNNYRYIRNINSIINNNWITSFHVIM